MGTLGIFRCLVPTMAHRRGAEAAAARWDKTVGAWNWARGA